MTEEHINGKAEKRYERIRYVVDNWTEIDTKEVKTSSPKLSELVEYFINDEGFSLNSIKNQIRNHDDYVVKDGYVIHQSEETHQEVSKCQNP